MSSHNVAIRKDVYDALRREKRPDESFTELLSRLLSERAPLARSFGAWGRVDRRGALRALRSSRGGAPQGSA
jgi:predicted CopG family antitoxin